MTTPADMYWVFRTPIIGHQQQPLPFFIIVSPTKPPDTSTRLFAAGPFKTQGEAQAWIDKQETGPVVSVPNPLAFLGWLQGIEHWVGVFVSAVTDLHTWISLGWGLLGMILLWLGVWWWFRSTEAGQRLAETSANIGMAAAK